MFKRTILSKIIPIFISTILIFNLVFFYFNTEKIQAANMGKVNASSLNVRTKPDTNSKKIATLPGGFSLNIIEELRANNLDWYRIQFNINNSTKEGFVAKSYISIISDNEQNYSYKADESFEDSLNREGFPENYKKYLRQLHSKYPNWIFKAQKTSLDWEEVIENQSLIGRNLVHKNSISSWKSTKAGAYDPNTKTWVGFDTNAWVAASEAIIRYYMDPRNFLDEIGIFQFLDNSYIGTYDKSALENMIRGTFLADKSNIGEYYSSYSSNNYLSSKSGPISYNAHNLGQDVISIEAPRISNFSAFLLAPGENYNYSNTPNNSNNSNNQGPAVYNNKNQGSFEGPGAFSNNSYYNVDLSGKTYADIILEAGRISLVNPYVLAAMIIQEQGTRGTSGLISGNIAPYQGYYNYFNIEAYQRGNQSPVQRGLWWASQEGSYDRPWNTRQKAIIGGAKYYGDNYVKANQNTLYLKKFNVLGVNRYKHQYMTNIEGAHKEAIKLSTAYNQGLKNTALVFAIPIYNNMPDNNEAIPTSNEIDFNEQNNSPTNMPYNSNNIIGPGANVLGPDINISNSSNPMQNSPDSKNFQSNVSLVAPQ